MPTSGQGAQDASIPTASPSTALRGQPPVAWGVSGEGTDEPSLPFHWQPSTTPARLPTSSVSAGTACPSGGPVMVTWTVKMVLTRTQASVVSGGAVGLAWSFSRSCCPGRSWGVNTVPLCLCAPLWLCRWVQCSFSGQPFASCFSIALWRIMGADESTQGAACSHTAGVLPEISHSSD